MLVRIPTIAFLRTRRYLLQNTATGLYVFENNDLLKRSELKVFSAKAQAETFIIARLGFKALADFTLIEPTASELEDLRRTIPYNNQMLADLEAECAIFQTPLPRRPKLKEWALQNIETRIIYHVKPEGEESRALTFPTEQHVYNYIDVFYGPDGREFWEAIPYNS